MIPPDVRVTLTTLAQIHDELDADRPPGLPRPTEPSEDVAAILADAADEQRGAA